MAKFSKANLVEELALHNDIAGNTNAAASRVVEWIFERIREEVAKGKDVKLSRFINLKAGVRPPKTGYVPKTKAKYSVPAVRVVKIKPTKHFKEQMKDA